MAYYDKFWRLLHVHLRRMCFLLCLDGMFCIYLSSSVLMYSLRSMSSHWCSIWMIYTLMKLEYIGPLQIFYCCTYLFSSNICFIYLAPSPIFQQDFYKILSCKSSYTLKYIFKKHSEIFALFFNCIHHVFCQSKFLCS